MPKLTRLLAGFSFLAFTAMLLGCGRSDLHRLRGQLRNPDRRRHAPRRQDGRADDRVHVERGLRVDAGDAVLRASAGRLRGMPHEPGHLPERRGVRPDDAHVHPPPRRLHEQRPVPGEQAGVRPRDGDLASGASRTPSARWARFARTSSASASVAAAPRAARAWRAAARRASTRGPTRRTAAAAGSPVPRARRASAARASLRRGARPRGARRVTSAAGRRA